jgi:hypothetical protein
MKPPFLLLEGGDINLFKTLEAMARYVESPDIDSYLAVDSTGTIVILSAEQTGDAVQTVGLIPITRVSATPSAQTVNRTQLHDRLLKYLLSVGINVERTSSLEEVVRQIQNKVGFTG